jgi:hypothetical protein
MIVWMIKGHPNRIDAKASKGVPGLTDDQGASDRKSDATAAGVIAVRRRHDRSRVMDPDGRVGRWSACRAARDAGLVARGRRAEAEFLRQEIGWHTAQTLDREPQASSLSETTA